MLSRIRTLRSLFSKSEPEAVHPISTVTPVGYHAPRAPVCCAPPRYEKPACSKYGRTALCPQTCISDSI